MRTHLTLLGICCACLRLANPQGGSAARVTVADTHADSLTSVERARIVDAVVRFRWMIFSTDTTIRLDPCSLAFTFGPNFLKLLTPDVRRLVARPTRSCTNAALDVGGFDRRLILRSINAEAGQVVVAITYNGGGTYLHEEEFKVRKASSRPDGIWAATEMRVYDAMIAD